MEKTPNFPATWHFSGPVIEWLEKNERYESGFFLERVGEKVCRALRESDSKEKGLEQSVEFGRAYRDRTRFIKQPPLPLRGFPSLKRRGELMSLPARHQSGWRGVRQLTDDVAAEDRREPISKYRLRIDLRLPQNHPNG